MDVKSDSSEGSEKEETVEKVAVILEDAYIMNSILLENMDIKDASGKVSDGNEHEQWTKGSLAIK